MTARRGCALKAFAQSWTATVKPGSYLSKVQSTTGLGLEEAQGQHERVERDDAVVQVDELDNLRHAVVERLVLGLVPLKALLEVRLDVCGQGEAVAGGRGHDHPGHDVRHIHGIPEAPIRPEPSQAAVAERAHDLRGLDDRPLDTACGFILDELDGEAADARHFLRTAGYLYLRGAFAPDEVASMLDDAAVIADEAVPGDQESWWGRNAAGDEVLTRVLRAASRPRLAALHDDLRVLRLVSMADQPLAAEVDQGPDRVTVLWKHPDMVDGLGDLPWHRDCGMGGHALNCPSVVVTICLTTGSPEAGELRFLPGSHRASFPFIDGTDVAAPEGASLPITAGDMTVHYSDVMHASLPPTSVDGPHRISVLLGFRPESSGHHRGKRHYNDALLGADDGQVENIGRRLAT